MPYRTIVTRNCLSHVFFLTRTLLQFYKRKRSASGATKAWRPSFGAKRSLNRFHEQNFLETCISPKKFTQTTLIEIYTIFVWGRLKFLRLSLFIFGISAFCSFFFIWYRFFWYIDNSMFFSLLAFFFIELCFCKIQLKNHFYLLQTKFHLLF